MVRTLKGGSSPLARGLPMLLRRASTIVGIIPARAGFTHSLDRTTLTTRDHPRSRGVYVPSTVVAFARAGSSPLARGLLGHGESGAPQERIIPARAGFTAGRGR